VNLFGQKIVEKSISSNADQIILEFNSIDEVRLFNSKKANEISIKAEGISYMPDFGLKEANGVVYVQENEVITDVDPNGADKVCSIEPNFTSYQVYVPESSKCYISIIEGNFSSENFTGDLNLIVEDGIVRLSHMNASVKVKLNSGSILVRGIENTEIDAKTNLGLLITDPLLDGISEDEKQVVTVLGGGHKSLMIRTILANIYLNVSED
jgi:hypothetical protein